MKHNFPTITIAAALVSSLTLSACGVFGDANEPEPPTGPNFETADTGDYTAAPPAPTFDLVIPTDSHAAPTITTSPATSTPANDPRSHFSGAVALTDTEVSCLNSTGVEEEDYSGLFVKSEQPTIAGARAIDDCLSDLHDRGIATWLAENRFELNDPAGCLQRELGNYVVNPGWETFLAETDTEGFAIFEDFKNTCGIDTHNHDDPHLPADTTADLQAEIVVAGLAANFTSSLGLDETAQECMETAFETVVDTHGLAALQEAFQPADGQIEIAAPAAIDVYGGIGGCAPYDRINARHNTAVGLARTLTDRLTTNEQTCLVAGFDAYIVDNTETALFQGFQDLSRRTLSAAATEVGAIIQNCASTTTTTSPVTSDLTGTDADIDYLTALAADLKVLSAGEQVCLRVWMPGIVTQFGAEQVETSLLLGLNEPGYNDDVIMEITVAAIDCR